MKRLFLILLCSHDDRWSCMAALAILLPPKISIPWGKQRGRRLYPIDSEHVTDRHSELRGILSGRICRRSHLHRRLLAVARRSARTSTAS